MGEVIQTTKCERNKKYFEAKYGNRKIITIKPNG